MGDIPDAVPNWRTDESHFLLCPSLTTLSWHQPKRSFLSWLCPCLLISMASGLYSTKIVVHQSTGTGKEASRRQNRDDVTFRQPYKEKDCHLASSPGNHAHALWQVDNDSLRRRKGIVCEKITQCVNLVGRSQCWMKMLKRFASTQR